MLSAVRPLGLSIKNYAFILSLVSVVGTVAGGATNYIYALNNPGADPYRVPVDVPSPPIPQPLPPEPPRISVYPNNERSSQPPGSSQTPIQVISIVRQTGWVSGGHDPYGVCQDFLREVINQFPGKKVSLAHFNEERRRKLFKFESRYSCQFIVEDNKK